MFFWLALVTFFSSILIYAFYPFNNAITIVDKPESNIAITDILTQHLAAEQAASLLNVSANNTRTKAYTSWITETTPYKVLSENYTAFVPAGYVFSSEPDDEHPAAITQIFCIDNSNNELTANCGVTSGEHSTTDFLVTYGDIPGNFDIYIQNLSRRSLGEKMFLTEYENGTSLGGIHLKTNCGVLECPGSAAIPSNLKDFDPNGTCVLNNTRYYTVRLPSAINIAEGQLVCITRLSATYKAGSNNNMEIVYPDNE